VWYHNNTNKRTSREEKCSYYIQLTNYCIMLINYKYIARLLGIILRYMLAYIVIMTI